MSNLFAGFSSVDITPQTGGMPLAGWGQTHLRLAANVMDPLHCYVTALGNSDKPEVLLVNPDLINADKNCYVNAWREAISKATGVPENHIIISGTHSHSVPDLYSSLESIQKYKAYLIPLIADTCKRAVADMKPARIFYGRTEIGKPGTRLNYVRHYRMVKTEKLQNYTEDDVVYSGNNFGFQYLEKPGEYTYIGHESEADPEMRIVELRRENANSIILANWQCHALITSGINCTNMTSDFPGAFRNALKKMVPHADVVYLQGACGNINPCTRIREEAILGLNLDPFTPNDDTQNDHRAYGFIMASYAKELLDQGLTESKDNTLEITDDTFVGTVNHERDALLLKIQPVLDAYGQEGNTRRVIHLAMEHGLNSPYEATGIRNNAQRPATLDLEIHALHIGDVGMVTAPYEMYDHSGKYIRANAPFPMTLIQGYSCDSLAYMPTMNTFPTTYEWNNTRFVRGTAEKLAERYVELLKKF